MSANKTGRAMKSGTKSGASGAPTDSATLRKALRDYHKINQKVLALGKKTAKLKKYLKD